MVLRRMKIDDATVHGFRWRPSARILPTRFAKPRLPT
jgi:hypothetical protein